MYNNFLYENRAVYEIMWKNAVEPDRPQVAIRRLCIACWIPKATNTNSVYVVTIAFPLHQCLKDRASMLRYAHITCLVEILLCCNTDNIA
jgi:hypothetical protein